MTGKVLRDRFATVFVFLASVLAALVFAAVVSRAARAEPVTDYVTFYEPVGRAVLEGRGLVNGDGSLAVRYPPGYPAIVAGVFGLARFLHAPEPVVMRVFVLVSFGLTTVFLFSLSRLLWGARPALFTAAVWATYPFALWLTLQPSSELPFMVVLFAGLLLCARTITSSRLGLGRYFSVGLLAGVAMLIRPIAIGLGAVLAVIVLIALRHRTIRVRCVAALLILAGNFLAVLPWEAWVHRRTGHVIPLSSAGVPTLRDGLTFAVRGEGRAGVSVPDDVRALMLDVNARYPELTSVGAVASVMEEQWRKRPMAVLKLYGLKVARSWYATDSQRLETPILFVQLFYLTALVWSARAAWKQHGPHRGAVVGIACLMAYFLVMNVLGLTLLRYSVPAIGLAMILLPAHWSRQK